MGKLVTIAALGVVIMAASLVIVFLTDYPVCGHIGFIVGVCIDYGIARTIIRERLRQTQRQLSVMRGRVSKAHEVMYDSRYGPDLGSFRLAVSAALDGGEPEHSE